MVFLNSVTFHEQGAPCTISSSLFLFNKPTSYGVTPCQAGYPDMSSAASSESIIPCLAMKLM